MTLPTVAWLQERPILSGVPNLDGTIIEDVREGRIHYQALDEHKRGVWDYWTRYELLEREWNDDDDFERRLEEL